MWKLVCSHNSAPNKQNSVFFSQISFLPALPSRTTYYTPQAQAIKTFSPPDHNKQQMTGYFLIHSPPCPQVINPWNHRTRKTEPQETYITINLPPLPFAEHETTRSAKHKKPSTPTNTNISTPWWLWSCKQEKTPIHKTHKTSISGHGYPPRPIVTCQHDRTARGWVMTWPRSDQSIVRRCFCTVHRLTIIIL